MNPQGFLDTNTLVRHAVRDEPEQAARATALLERIAREEVSVRTADTVVFETVYTLQRFYRVPRSDIRAILLPLLALPAIILPGKGTYQRVFDLYVAHPALSFADCYHAVLARHLQLDHTISFDRGFDRLPEITRIEPA